MNIDPCPFCGEPNDLEVDNSDTNSSTWVICHGCGARGAIMKSHEQAVSEWNRRAAQPSHALAVRAVEELGQLGYKVKDDLLFPPVFSPRDAHALRSRLTEVADTLPLEPMETCQLAALLREAAAVAAVPPAHAMTSTVADLAKLANSNALPVMKSLERAGHKVTLNQPLTMDQIADALAVEQPQGTPSSKWAAAGEPDPHGTQYDCERAQLAMGKLTDDELANGAFMNYDVRPTLEQILAGKAHSPIAWMTAVKDRIRWLSRRLELASKAAPIVVPQDVRLSAEFTRQDLGPTGTNYPHVRAMLGFIEALIERQAPAANDKPTGDAS